MKRTIVNRFNGQPIVVYADHPWSGVIAGILVTLLLLPLVLSTGCASAADPEVVKLLEETCALYQAHRPEVLALRSFAIANKEKLPSSVWETLVRVDKILPHLDRLGAQSCDYAALARTLSRSQARDWKSAVELVVNVALGAKKAGLI